MTRFTEAERAGLAQLKDQIQSGQRNESPTDSRLEFARRRRDSLLREESNVSGQTNEDSAAIKAAKAHLEQVRLEMPLREKAEDIRARIEARAKYDDQAMKLVIADRDKELPVTRLGMQMRVEVEGKSEEETINLGIVVGTDRGNEDGTVLISSLLVKYVQSDNLRTQVETQSIEARILPGGKFFLRENVVDLRKERRDEYNHTYSVVYPRPDQPESDIDTIVADEEEAIILLKRLKILVNNCLTQPNLSFYRKKDSGRALLK